MDVNAALEGAAGATKEALEPDDASHDGVATAGVGRDDFTGRRTIPDNGTERKVGADFIVNPEKTDRSFVAVGRITDPETGRGDGEFVGGTAIFEHGELLIGNGDDDLRAKIDGPRTGGKKENEEESGDHSSTNRIMGNSSRRHKREVGTANPPPATEANCAFAGVSESIFNSKNHFGFLTMIFERGPIITCMVRNPW